MMNVVEQIGAVVREVRAGEREGRPTQTVSAIRTYRTSREDVWEAMTDPSRLARWFTPVSGDLRLGGRYQLEGNASGEITRCEPPSALALTWEFGGDTSWVDVELTDNGDGTTLLKLEHTQVPGDHWKRFGAGATGVGWDLGLLGLEQFLSTGSTVDPLAWPASAEGKAFMRKSGEDWCRAAIASGEDAAHAKDATARTIAFYSGEGEPPNEAGATH